MRRADEGELPTVAGIALATARLTRRPWAGPVSKPEGANATTFPSVRAHRRVPDWFPRSACRAQSNKSAGSAIPPNQCSSQPISSRVSMSEVFVQQHFNKSQMRPRERDRTYPDSKTPPSVVKNKSLPGVKG